MVLFSEDKIKQILLLMINHHSHNELLYLLPQLAYKFIRVSM